MVLNDAATTAFSFTDAMRAGATEVLSAAIPEVINSTLASLTRSDSSAFGTTNLATLLLVAADPGRDDHHVLRFLRQRIRHRPAGHDQHFDPKLLHHHIRSKPARR